MLRDLPGDVVAAQPKLVVVQPEPASPQQKKFVSPEKMFNDLMLKGVKIIDKMTLTR